jgi:hypothetical protein
MEGQDQTQIPAEILSKLQKLLTLRDVSNVQAEIENAAARIQEILLKYNLTMADISSKDPKKKETMGRGNFHLDGLQKKTEANWVFNFLSVICEHNLCAAVLTYSPTKGKHRGTVNIIGTHFNIEMVKFLASQLIPRIKNACKTAWKEFADKVDEKENTFKRGFYRGCVLGIHYKLQAQEEQLKRENSNMGLMVIKNWGEVIKAKDEIFGNNLKENKAGQSGRKQSDSILIGYKAGQDMEINKGLGNDKETRGLLK